MEGNPTEKAPTMITTPENITVAAPAKPTWSELARTTVDRFKEEVADRARVFEDGLVAQVLANDGRGEDVYRAIESFRAQIRWRFSRAHHSNYGEANPVFGDDF